MGVDETKGNEEEGEENERRKKGDESGDECGWDRPLLLLPLLLTLIRGATNKETTQRSGGWCFFQVLLVSADASHAPLRRATHS